jgi:hypothetical protein
VVAADERDQVRGRALVVKRLRPLPIEAVVRGYLIGSGWKDYQADRQPSAASRCRQDCGWRAGCRADLHPGDQGGNRRSR